MNTGSNTGKALSLSILSTFLCVCMLFGITYAWFKVDINSGENVIKIGAFDVNVYYSNTYKAANASDWSAFEGANVFNNVTLIPGDEVVRYVKFVNNCDYPVKFDLALPTGFSGNAAANNIKVYTADTVSAAVTTSNMTEYSTLKTIEGAATADAPAGIITKVVGAKTNNTPGTAIVAVGVKLPDDYNTPSTSTNSLAETFKLRVIATQWNAPHTSVTAATAAEQTLTADNVTVIVPAADVAANDNFALVVSNISSTEGTFNCDIALKKNDKTVENAPSPITVNINIGKEKTVTSLTHNGTAITNYEYNATTGILTFTTSSFSPFEVIYETGVYEAKIGETKYETLQAALNAAKDNDRVVLATCIKQDAGFLFDSADKTVDLDLNGKTITVNNGANVNNRAIKIVDGTLNVYNGSIVAVGSGTDSSNGSGCYGAFRIEADGTLNATDLTLKNSRPWGLNVKVLGGVASLTNVTIDSSYGGGIEVTEANLGEQSKTGKATLTNCTFKQSNYFDHCSSAISVSGGSSLTVNSGTYEGEYAAYVFSSGGVIDIKGGTFTAKSKDVVIAAIDINTYPQYTGGLTISGGDFNGTFKITSPAYLRISGGTFDHDPSAYVTDSGYTITQSNGKWIVQQSVAVNAKAANRVLLPKLITP